MMWVIYDNSGSIVGFKQSEPLPDEQGVHVTDEYWMQLIQQPSAYWIQDGEVVLRPGPTPEEAAAELRALRRFAVSSKRYEVETGRTVTAGGHAIRTDERTQLKIFRACFNATQNPDYSANWKCVDGFSVLSGAELQALGEAMDVHVQACFNREDELLQAVETGDYYDSMLEEGWPS